MLAAAYMTAGFLVAGVFAVAQLRGNWGRYQRLAFAIPFTVASIVAPLQMLIGDTVARTVFQEMPVKFAAIEIVWNTGSDEPEIILGRLNQDTGVIEGGLPIPGMASYLSGFSTSTVIQGLSTVPRENQPPANIVHFAWDGMVFGGTGLALLAAWFLVYWIFRRRLPGTKWFYRCAAVAGVLSVFCVECGWIVTEVGRQPWIVYNYLRTADAVTNAGIARPMLAIVVVIYVIDWRGDSADAARHVAALGRRRDACAEWAVRADRRAAGDCVSPPARDAYRRQGERMSLADLVAAVLLLAVTAYAVLAGADFGAGFWDLVAGGTRKGAQPRALINRAVGPVWEVNHVWLIFCLVVLWTAFPPAFGSIMTTLAIPLSLALLGIVLRGAGFAFRHEAERLSRQRLFGGIFAISSVLTPFFFGTVIGGIASGRVPVGNAAGDLVTSWLNPTSVVIGLLAVAAAAYLSAVFLVTDARRMVDPDLEEYFRRRAILAAVVAGLIAAVGVLVLRADDSFLFQGLAQRGWPLLLLSGAAGLGALLIMRRSGRRATRVLAALAVASMVWGWGVAQYPYLLPQSLTISAGAGAPATLQWLVVVVVAALLLVLPSLIFVFRLDQQSRLEVNPLEIHT